MQVQQVADKYLTLLILFQVFTRVGAGSESLTDKGNHPLFLAQGTGKERLSKQVTLPKRPHGYNENGQFKSVTLNAKLRTLSWPIPKLLNA